MDLKRCSGIFCIQISCLLDSFFMDSLEEVANRHTNFYGSTLNANDDEEEDVDITEIFQMAKQEVIIPSMKKTFCEFAVRILPKTFLSLSPQIKN